MTRFLIHLTREQRDALEAAVMAASVDSLMPYCQLSRGTLTRVRAELQKLLFDTQEGFTSEEAK
jgi:hypothetical protein